MTKSKQEILKEFRDDIYGKDDALFDRSGNNVSRQVENWISKALTQAEQRMLEKVKNMLENKVQVFSKYNLCDDCQKVFTERELVPYVQDSLDEAISNLKNDKKNKQGV